MLLLFRWSLGYGGFDLWLSRGARLLQLLDGLDGGAGVVELVGRTERLGDDVLDPGQFHDHAGGATGNNTRTLARWLEQHFSGAKLAYHHVRNSIVDRRHRYQILFGGRDRFGDGRADVTALFDRQAHPPFAVTDDDDGAETHAFAPRHHPGNPGDV